MNSIENNGNEYYPIQPANVSNILEREKKRSTFSKDIAFFYQFKTRIAQIVTVWGVPDGCFDILFESCSEKVTVYLLTGPSQLTKLNLQSGRQFFGIRFYPEQKVLKLNHSMKELFNKFILLDNIISIDSHVIEKIGISNSFYERVKIFEDFLQDTAAKSNTNQNIFEYCIRKIYSTRGNISVEQLSQELACSDRYLRKKFEENTGFSPKQFSRIIRFQSSAKMLVNTPKDNLLDTIYSNGYYDQSHFIREFKKITNLTPLQFKKLYL